MITNNLNSNPPILNVRNENEKYMATVVKIIKDHWGQKVINPKWHLLVNAAATNRTLCGGEAVGMGDSAAEFEEKECVKGSITCEACKTKLKWFKSIKL